MPAGRRLALLASALLAGPTPAASQSLAPLFADHAVVQRDRPLRIWGTARAADRVRVSLAGRSAQALADAQGNWSVDLPPLKAGGPHRLEARFASGAIATASDILVGDVWLCSGQSNMEWPVSRALSPDGELASAADPQLRLITIPKKTALAPAASFADPPQWKVADKDSVAAFSAACYFMARELRTSERVPFGLINASWGGTAVRPWIEPASAARAAADDVALLALYRRDPPAAARTFGEQWQEWWNSQQKIRPWADPQALQWRPMKVGFWEQWGDPDFAKFNGMVWARSTVSLTAAEAAQPAMLTLGVIDEIDQSWVNGVPVGNTFGWDIERSYPIARGVLRAGDNEILVNILDSYGFGGFQGPESKLALRLADGTVKPLAPTLRYSVVTGRSGDPPRPPWDQAAGLSLIYNGMIAPLGPYGLKGAAWYQGETDAGMAQGYARRLGALMSGWREQFRAPALPFLIVGLAGYGKPRAAPGESGWAQVQDEQRRAAASDRSATFVPALDLGERDDIHPPNKQEVGRRLAMAARSAVYDGKDDAIVPLPVAAKLTAAGVEVRFTRPVSTFSGSRPLGFELCGPTQASCRFADASVNDSTVTLRLDGQVATRVRYAWSDFAIVNLYAADLPVPTFELPVR